MNKRAVRYYELVSINIQSAGQPRHYFKEQDLLRGKYIWGIDLHNLLYIFTAPVVLDGGAFINETAKKNGFLVLVGRDKNGVEIINRVPLPNLSAYEMYGKRFEFEPMIIDWPKSYVHFSDLAALVANEEILFGFYADDNKLPLPQKYEPVAEFENLSIIVNNVNLREFKFGENDLLRNKYIKGIVSYDINLIPKDSNGYALTTFEQYGNGYLILVSKESGKQTINKIPLIRLNSYIMFGEIFYIDPMLINWAESKVVFSDIAALSLNECISFAFLVSDKK